MRLEKNYQLLIILIFVINNINTQNIPYEFFESKYDNYFLDIGQDWDRNSNLGVIRFQDLKNFESYSTMYPESLYINLRGGLYTFSSSTAIYNFSHFIYKKYLYGYLYPRVINNEVYIDRFTGIPREISRFGFNSGETDLSGIGFQNNWLRFQIGRGSESWSAGSDIAILVSKFSPSYDYFLLGSDYGNLRVRYFHGFLESNLNQINRYIIGKGVEYSNKKSIIISFSETVIYSGFNKSLDFAYLNPISSHLEIELNNRLNHSESGGANAVWQFSSDLMYKDLLRFSFNYIIDEYVLDEIQKKEGKENGLAYSYRLAISPNQLNKKVIFNFYASYIKVGTPTFRHGIGSNNFVQRGVPLGWEFGSDGNELKIGLKYFDRKKLSADVCWSNIKFGSESILYRPYEKYKDYLKGTFPSGYIKKTNTFTTQIEYNVKKNFRVMSIIEGDKIKNISLKFGLKFYLSNKFYVK